MYRYQFGGDDVTHNVDSKVHVIPCPHEQTTSYLKGTEYGPDSILKASEELEFFDIETKKNILNETNGIYTHNPVDVVGKKPDEIFNSLYLKTKGCLDNDQFPIIIGGEHSLSIGSFKACHEKYPDISVLHFDAHSDLRYEYMGSKNNHACAMRRIRELTENTVSIGVRSMPEEDYRLMQDENIKIFFGDTRDGLPPQMKICDLLNNNVYITIDIDCLDPSIMPAVGTPEPGGLKWHELLSYLMYVFKNKNVVGCDIVELKPQKGMEYADFIAAKLLFKIVNYKFGL